MTAQNPWTLWLAMTEQSLAFWRTAAGAGATDNRGLFGASVPQMWGLPAVWPGLPGLSAPSTLSFPAMAFPGMAFPGMANGALFPSAPQFPFAPNMSAMAPWLAWAGPFWIGIWTNALTTAMGGAGAPAAGAGWPFGAAAPGMAALRAFTAMPGMGWPFASPPSPWSPAAMFPFGGSAGRASWPFWPPGMMGLPGMGLPGMSLPGMSVPGMGLPGMGLPGMGLPGLGAAPAATLPTWAFGSDPFSMSRTMRQWLEPQRPAPAPSAPLTQSTSDAVTASMDLWQSMLTGYGQLWSDLLTKKSR